jgi:hypothetical protein
MLQSWANVTKSMVSSINMAVNALKATVLVFDNALLTATVVTISDFRNWR